jgi:tryptophan synthase alpha chain
LYYVSLKGITGAGNLDVDSVAAKLPLIKRHTSVPVGVGFGIKDAATAQAVGRVADAVVVGSRLIQALESVPTDQALKTIADVVGGMRRALDELKLNKEVA